MADRAGVRLLPSVGSVVPVQPRWHREGLATLVAPVGRLWVGVDVALHVLLQGGPRGEILLTEAAVVGSSLGSRQLLRRPGGVDALLDHHQLLADPRLKICWVHQGFHEAIAREMSRWLNVSRWTEGWVAPVPVSTRKPPDGGRARLQTGVSLERGSCSLLLGKDPLCLTQPWFALLKVKTVKTLFHVSCSTPPTHAKV